MQHIPAKHSRGKSDQNSTAEKLSIIVACYLKWFGYNTGRFNNKPEALTKNGHHIRSASSVAKIYIRIIEMLCTL